MSRSDWSTPAETAPHTADAVNHPPHYKVAGVECIDVIEALGLGFHLGNALKYLWRAGRKDAAKHLEDLKKSRFYLDREIARLEKPTADATRRGG